MFLTSNHPDSAPFLLVHRMTASDDIMDDEADTIEIPASKSVPPHVPPARVITTETDLPSVIVELKELEVAELQRASEVDGLLVATETLVAIEDEPSRAGQTRRTRIRSRAAANLPRFAIALVAALSAAGATFAGLKVSHVPAGSLGAALHVVR